MPAPDDVNPEKDVIWEAGSALPKDQIAENEMTWANEPEGEESADIYEADFTRWEQEQGLESLRYTAGWQEIMHAPDAADYRVWLDDFVELTQTVVGTERVVDKVVAKHDWQLAIEQVADISITEVDKVGLTEAEMLETAFLTLQATLDALGYQEEGLCLVVPNLELGEEYEIEFRKFGMTSGSEGQTDKIRDVLMESAPQHRDLIQARDNVVNAYCAEKGLDKDSLTMEQILEIRSLPAWQDPFGTTGS
jgi:hypothetical protein